MFESLPSDAGAASSPERQRRTRYEDSKHSKGAGKAYSSLRDFECDALIIY